MTSAASPLRCSRESEVLEDSSSRWLPAWLPGRQVHGSGVRLSDLANLCTLPAWTRSLFSPGAEIIPRIFRIMELPPCPPAPCRGWPASGPGRLRPGPWFLTGVSAVVSRVKRDFACTLTVGFPPVLVVLRAQSRLRLEGRTRTLSGPSLDPSPARTLTPFLCYSNSVVFNSGSGQTPSSHVTLRSMSHTYCANEPSQCPPRSGRLGYPVALT